MIKGILITADSAEDEDLMSLTDEDVENVKQQIVSHPKLGQILKYNI